MIKAEVILYTRPGCHLCDVAKAAMAGSGCRDSYELTEVNIDSDPLLVERYGNHIPVVLINGVEAFRHHVDPEDFRVRVLGL